MKYFFSSILIASSIWGSAQFTLPNIPLDSARQLVRSATLPEDRFFGYYSMDDYYATSGLYDSSRQAQWNMFQIAEAQGSDSLMASVYFAIGNMQIHQSEYNYALGSYIKALEYARDDFRRARIYGSVGYLYVLLGNSNLGVGYIRKADSIAHSAYLKNRILPIFYSAAYNAMRKPDSALWCLQRADMNFTADREPSFQALQLSQYSKAYALKGEDDLTDLYCNKTLSYCKTQNLVSTYIRAGNFYCRYLFDKGKLSAVKNLALNIMAIARQTGSNEGISQAAESLRKFYGKDNNKDSALYYAEIQIRYQDSLRNEKQLADMQNLSFSQQLRDMDLDLKKKQMEEQRIRNLEYALIAVGIILLVILYLLISHRFLRSARAIEFFGVIALLLVFEFFNLLLHPFLEKITHHSPLLMLLGLVGIAAILVPFHHWLEKWAIQKIVEKNKENRLASARKTIHSMDQGMKS